MSRKARIEKSTWKVPSLYAFVGEYCPFKVKDFQPVENTLIWLYNSNEQHDDDDGKHPMFPLAGTAQEILLQPPTQPSFSTILVVDVKDMFESKEEYENALNKEIEEDGLTKKFGKLMLRMLHRLELNEVMLGAQGSLCALVLKLLKALQRIDVDMVKDLWLLHPELSTKYINTHLVASQKFSARLNVITKPKSNSRVSILKHFFPALGVEIVGDAKHLFSTIANLKDSNVLAGEYNPDCYNDLGKTLFMSDVKIEMNEHSKQYERICTDITSDLMVVKMEGKNNNGDVDWDNCQRHVGALVLRGNRCVLARSLFQEWEGMRIPSVIPKADENPHDAAIRAFVEFTEVEANEVEVLNHVLPVAVYAPNDRPIIVDLYPLYTTSPPPDGALEDADMEDDESEYDWYTYPNAIKKLDKPSIAALQTMALNLVQAASIELVPAKWGGVFGQEKTN